MTEGHTRSAYHRRQRKTIESALKVARFDERGALPAHRPTNYLDTFFTLTDDATFESFVEEERYIGKNGASKQRRLGDFAEQEADA